MAKKAKDESAQPVVKHGFEDIIGVLLILLAVLLCGSQISFDPHDLSFVSDPPNHPPHNWIGTLGAHLAFVFFFVLGEAAYILPALVATFGFGCLFDFMSYLRRHTWWSALAGFVLLLSLTGLL